MQTPVFTWKKISVVLTAVVLVGAAITVISPYRFWASVNELEQHVIDDRSTLKRTQSVVAQVAQVTYDTAVARERDNLRGIQLAIDKCKANGDCLEATLLRLQRQEQESKNAIDRFQREHNRILAGG